VLNTGDNRYPAPDPVISFSLEYRNGSRYPEIKMANPAPRILYLEQPNAVTLRLGRDQIEMLVDAKHLARTSDRFNALLAAKIPEGQPRILSLPMVPPHAMSVYINFINFGSLPTTSHMYVGHTPLPTPRNKIYVYLTQLYFLTLDLEDRTFSNAVMREVLRIFDLCRPTAEDGGVPGCRTIQVMYGSLPASGVGRRLLVDMYTNFGSAGQLDLRNGAIHPTFLQDLAQNLLQKATDNKAPDSYRLQPLDPADYMI
jgi:hypothetical protein